MAWSTPTARAAGYVVPYTVWNSDAVDNPIALRAGAIAIASQATGDLIYATSSTQFGRIADVATGQVLVSGGVGVAPAWSATPTLTGTNITGIPWAGVSKAGSSLADLTTRAVANLSDGSNVALLNAANTFTALGATNFAGNLSISGTSAGIGVRIRNTAAGAANYTEIRLGNDSSVGVLDFYATSTTYTPSGALLADAGAVYAGHAGGLSLAAAHDSGDVRVYSRGVLAATFGASQAATFAGKIIPNGGSGAGHGFTFESNALYARGGTGGFIFNSNNDTANLLTLSNAGAVRLHAYGAGYLVTDASGNVTATAAGSFTTGTFSSTVVFSSTARFNDNLLNVSGNIMDSQGTPTITSGGSAIAGRDYAFKYTHTSMGTVAVIAFGGTWTTAPICTVTSDQPLYGTYISAVSTTSITIGFLNATAGSPTVYVHCRGY